MVTSISIAMAAAPISSAAFLLIDIDVAEGDTRASAANVFKVTSDTARSPGDRCQLPASRVVDPKSLFIKQQLQM